LQDEEISLPLTGITAAEPPKGAFIFVLKGMHNGRSGVVKVRFSFISIVSVISYCFFS
jgi:hypothetical protein